MRFKSSIFVFLAIVLLAVAEVILAQTFSDKSTVIGTEHDIGGVGCAGCHVPHQATARGRTLLWALAFTTQIFGTYSSDTMDTTPVEVGDPTYSDSNPPTGGKLHTVLCLSCHDGVTSPTLIGPTDGAAIANPTNQDGLKNDHPVNMTYDPSLDPGLNPLATVTATNVRLFDADSVQCASCHDPHDAPGLPDFLRVTNSGSQLCITCHL